MKRFPKKAPQFVSREAIAAEILRLAGLPLAELRTAWASEFRYDPPEGLWKDLLLRTLAWHLQEKVFGGYDKATLSLLQSAEPKRAGDQRCKRLKTGTVLMRDFCGTRHTVTIVPDGFIWQEKTYPSLTAIARIITGTNWNGPRFFGLREGEGRKAGKQQETAA